jgi:predicted AAA+ superfamily ATPase
MKDAYSDDSVFESLLRDFWERPPPDLTPRNSELLGRPGKADVLIGMRRSGKTYRLFQEIARVVESGIDRRHVLYLNFEDDRLGPPATDLLPRALECFYRLSPEARERGAFLFFDEVQAVPGWSRFLRRVLDTERAQVYATGSSAKLLSTEVATEFRGRGFATEILPFSFSEYLRHQGVAPPDRTPGARLRSRLESHLDRYLLVGGMPEVQDYDDPDRIRTLQDYVELVLVRDVVQRHELANVTAARWFALAALSATASLFSVSKMYKDFRSRGLEVAKDTLYALLDHFEDAFLLFTVPVYRKSLRARRATPRKAYAVDPGLARAVSHAMAGDLGARLETAVYLELRRRAKDSREGHISYYLTRSRREVDFVVGRPEEEHVASLVQVSADLRNAETRHREIRALEEAMGETGTKSGLVITLHESGTEETASGPVHIVPAWMWLLGLPGPGG